MTVYSLPKTPMGHTVEHIEELVPRRNAYERFKWLPDGEAQQKLRGFQIQYEPGLMGTEWLEAEYETEFVRPLAISVYYPKDPGIHPVELQEMIAEDHEDIVRALHHRQMDYADTLMVGRDMSGAADLRDEGDWWLLMFPCQLVIHRGG